MATLDEWLPLEQFLKLYLRRKAQSFKRLCAFGRVHKRTECSYRHYALWPLPKNESLFSLSLTTQPWLRGMAPTEGRRSRVANCALARLATVIEVIFRFKFNDLTRPVDRSRYYSVKKHASSRCSSRVSCNGGLVGDKGRAISQIPFRPCRGVGKCHYRLARSDVEAYSRLWSKGDI